MLRILWKFEHIFFDIIFIFGSQATVILVPLLVFLLKLEKAVDYQAGRYTHYILPKLYREHSCAMEARQQETSLLENLRIMKKWWFLFYNNVFSEPKS